MKIVQTSVIVSLAFFLSAGISFGAELDDIDFTIRIVESDDMSEIYNELSLPDMVFDTAGERTEERVSQFEVGKHENEVEAHDERENAVEDHDEVRGDDKTHEDEHEEEHRKEDD